MRGKALLVVVLFASGCSGMSYALDNYSGVTPTRFNDGREDWRVFDKPHENRLMITPTLGDSAAGGAALGLTFGASGPVGGPEGNFQRGAQAWLDASGRKCRITNGALVVAPQYEFFYTCS
jgi:hypothetical protein